MLAPKLVSAAHTLMGDSKSSLAKNTTSSFLKHPPAKSAGEDVSSVYMCGVMFPLIFDVSHLYV